MVIVNLSSSLIIIGSLNIVCISVKCGLLLQNTENRIELPNTK